MSEEFFDEEEMRLGIENGVEREDGARAFKAITGEVEF